MRLENCVFDIHFVKTAPLQWHKPEEEWLESLKDQSIPQELFNLYSRAGHLSFGSAPSFLADKDNLLFSYFGMILRSIRGSLAEANENLNAFQEAAKLAYDPGKKFRGESWDPSAHERSRRHFKYLLISLQSALDATGDLVAIFFTGLVPNLRLGRAQFSRVEVWLAKPLASTGLITSPQLHYLSKLYDAWQPVVRPQPPSSEQGWLPLMRMLRNKAAHLGDGIFRTVGLHDTSPKFYDFVPRMWPYIWERHIKPAKTPSPDPSFFRDLCIDTLVHQDIDTFAQGLFLKVRAVVAVGVDIVCEVYDSVSGFQPNQAALAELEGSSERHSFEYFESTA